MRCEWFREALSAGIDGEAAGVDEIVLDAHLAECKACRTWMAAAHDLARATRVTPAPAVPDLSAAILAAARNRGWRAEPDRPRRRLRWALGIVAVVQLVLALPSLLFGAGGEAPTHVAHELGSWDLALAVGFLFAAIRPARAWGMLPLVAALVASLLLTTGVDVADGHAALADESAHILEVVGLGLLWALAHRPATRRRLRLRLA